MDHTRTKIGRSHEAHDIQADIISDLPRDVIHEIWERLPLQDAARMSVLSHKWQDIWTSTPHLAFDHCFFTSVLKEELRKTLKFCCIVSKILFQHEGPIHKFSLFVPPLNACPDVSQWISHLSRNGLRDFSLCNMYTSPLKLSPRLFSCGDLEKLKLNFCIFSPPLNIRGFPKLTSLELDRVFLTYKTFKDLIGKCPILQNLNLTNFSGMEHRNIVIDAPNLRHLILDWLFESLEVKICENLLSASFGMQKLVNVVHKASLCNLIKVLANSSTLKRLCFRGHFCRILFKAGSLRINFEKLKILELLYLHLDYLDDFSSVTSCIQSFPNIEALKITVTTSTNLAEHVLDYNPNCTLHHLSCAKVGIMSASSTELKLIEFLLACSPVLEKLSVHTPLKKNPRSRMLMQLNRFRRASRKVEVICPESILINRSVHVATSTSTSDSSSESD